MVGGMSLLWAPRAPALPSAMCSPRKALVKGPLLGCVVMVTMWDWAREKPPPTEHHSSQAEWGGQSEPRQHVKWEAGCQKTSNMIIRCSLVLHVMPGMVGEPEKCEIGLSLQGGICCSLFTFRVVTAYLSGTTACPGR